ncbi:Hypothetical predicted protein [Octopus vulgaris]|uniref:Uncharacterized protein n=1 Tax=Octopus vulgaris TaxID=6645 RepID=A0AA36ALC3_OCTVU|nr:Hypothetical predicted protein [Octopus vulgaris]
MHYSDIPYNYVFNKQTTVWKRRQRNGDKVIYRLYKVSQKDEERFYLRLLLMHVTEARSYEDMKTKSNIWCHNHRRKILYVFLQHRPY